MAKKKLYVFAGKFNSLEEACLYSEPQWEPEPDDSVSDGEYSIWEDRNPTHELKENIDTYLDNDFIETVECDFEYLLSYRIKTEDIGEIRIKAKEANFFVLVYEDALGGFPLDSEPKSNSVLTYCGSYVCVL